MSTEIVQCPNMTLVIKRLTDYTVRHLSGLSNIPHLCVKVRHANGFSWFGVNVIGVTDTQPWSDKLEKEIHKLFIDAMQRLADMEALDTDINMLMRSLQDITTGRKRPILFGGETNEFIHICADNNVQIELYREEVRYESTTYGGYFVPVECDGTTYAAVVYHRGIILYNYLTKEAVQQLLRDELLSKFPEVFKPNTTTIRNSEMTLLPRNRNRRNSHGEHANPRS